MREHLLGGFCEIHKHAAGVSIVRPPGCVRRIYNFVYSLGLLLGAPFMLFEMWIRGQSMEGFRQRFGRYTPNLKQALTNRHVLWVHISSSEHVHVASRLLKSLQQRLPNAKLLVSARTAATMTALRRGVPGQFSKVYLPLDRKTWVARSLSSINPRAVIVVGTDLWPNFLWRANQRGTPTLLLTARLAGAGRRGFQRFDSLLKPVCRRLSGAAVAYEADAKAAIALGCQSGVVQVAGDLRLDGLADPEASPAELAASRVSLGFAEDAQVILGSGVTVREALALLRIFKKLRKPDIALALSADGERDVREITRELRRQSIRYTYQSEMPMRRAPKRERDWDCVIIDTPGELRRWREISALVFLGNSLYGAQGQGHDPVAAAASGRPVLFGPNMGEYAEAAILMVRRKAAMRVTKAGDLGRAMQHLLEDKSLAAELALNARALGKEHAGATDRCVEMILASLDEDLYVSPVANPARQPE